MPTVVRRGDSFLCQVRVQRNGVKVFSESKTFPTSERALAWGRRLEAELQERGATSVSTRHLTVGQLVLKHLAYQRSLREVGRSSIHTHESIAQAFHNVGVNQLTAKRVVDYARRRAAEGAAPATIAAELSPVRAAFHAAPHAHGIRLETDEIDTALRKLREMGLSGRGRHAGRAMTAAEEAALRAEFARQRVHHQAVIDMVLWLDLALSLPRRLSELARLRWADVNLDRGIIVIRDVKHPRRKVGNDQEVPLLPTARAAIARAPKVDEMILPWLPGSVAAAFERARDRIAETGMPGIKGLRTHDMRATGISRLLKAGLPIPQVAMISGHTNWQQVARYARLTAEDVHESWEKLR
jgi:integrase